jgi:hypothetical protein
MYLRGTESQVLMKPYKGHEPRNSDELARSVVF